MKQNSTIAIKLTNVSKKYEIRHEKPTLVEKFVNGNNEIFWALSDVNLTIKKGERVGIIGSNGSGKTTLLKILAGITVPTSGTIRIQGRTVSLIDLEAGFHDDLTGIQNIFLNGMLIGMSKVEITRKLKDIIDFADIKQFIDTPLFTYSFGMKLRLGFSIAIHADPDILLLDESLSVGDSNFRNKSERIIKSFYGKNITIVVVSHWLDLLKRNCQRIIAMENGTIWHTDSKRLIEEYK